MQAAEIYPAYLKTTFKHLRTNRTYCLLLQASDKTTGEEVVVFQSVKTGRVWIRPSREFFDGRYQEITGATGAQPSARATANVGDVEAFGGSLVGTR